MMVIAFPRSKPKPKPKNGSPTTIRRASPSNTMSSAARPDLQHKHSNRSLPGRAACLGNGSSRTFASRHKQPSIGTRLNFITPADYTSEVRSWHAAVRAAFSVAILRNDDRLRPEHCTPPRSNKRLRVPNRRNAWDRSKCPHSRALRSVSVLGRLGLLVDCSLRNLR